MLFPSRRDSQSTDEACGKAADLVKRSLHFFIAFTQSEKIMTKLAYGPREDTHRQRQSMPAQDDRRLRPHLSVGERPEDLESAAKRRGVYRQPRGGLPPTSLSARP